MGRAQAETWLSVQDRPRPCQKGRPRPFREPAVSTFPNATRQTNSRRVEGQTTPADQMLVTATRQDRLSCSETAVKRRVHTANCCYAAQLRAVVVHPGCAGSTRLIKASAKSVLPWAAPKPRHGRSAPGRSAAKREVSLSCKPSILNGRCGCTPAPPADDVKRMQLRRALVLA